MLRTASSLPPTGLLTLGSGPARFQARPPACYRASWQLPGPDFHPAGDDELTNEKHGCNYLTAPPPALLGALQILYRLFFRSFPNSSIEHPSTPGAPLLALTLSHASHTSRFEISNGFPEDFSSSTQRLPENLRLIERTNHE